MGPPSTLARKESVEAFTVFVADVLERAEVTIPVILTSLVYIHRAKPHVQIHLEQWACERVFLGAIILADKVRQSIDLYLDLEKLIEIYLCSMLMIQHSRMRTGRCALVSLGSEMLAALSASS